MSSLIRTWFLLGRCRPCLLLPRVALLLLLLLPHLPPPARAAVGEPPRIESITLEGNAHLSDRRLRGEMRLSTPRWWNPFSRPRYTGADFLASDLRAILFLYQSEGFPLARIDEAAVAYNEKGDRVRIGIRIDEGPRVNIRGLSIRGVYPGWVREITQGTTLKLGEPLSWPRIGAERDRINDFCGERGYARSRTLIEVRYREDTADLSFTVDPGQQIRVGAIEVTGLARSREEMVRRELTFRPGDLLRRSQVTKSQERLLSSGVFTRARVNATYPDSTQPKADITVQVSERKHAWVAMGAGYSSSDQVRLDGEWGLNNLTGMGRAFSVDGSIYYSLGSAVGPGGASFKEGDLSAAYTEPWLFGTRTRGTLSPYINWKVQDTGAHSRTYGLSGTLGKELSQYTRLALTLRSERVRTDETGPTESYTTNSLKLDGIDDRRTNIFDPAGGHFAEITSEYAGGPLKGSNTFSRFLATWQEYESLQRGWVAAFRLKAGQIVPLGSSPVTDTYLSGLGINRLARIPPLERFRTGGGNTVRGYPEGRLGRNYPSGDPTGGLLLLLANAEIRFPLFWLVQGGLFVDAGNVWADPRELTAARIVNGFKPGHYDPLNIAVGAGMGLRITTPVGPFRFDYGFKAGSGRAPGESAGKLHVALGQAF